MLKPGDVVRCVAPAGILKLNSIYVIKYIWRDMVSAHNRVSLTYGGDDHKFFTWRFEKLADSTRFIRVLYELSEE